MRRYGWLVVALGLLAWWAWQAYAPAPAVDAPSPVAQRLPDRAPGRVSEPLASPSTGDARRWPAFLPREALDTLQRIEHGGPFEHRQDGGTFGNRERLLPQRPRGYYREYTVETPGSRDRGARRIVTGGDPPVEYYYTDDHYRSFRRFQAGRSEASR